MKGVTRIVKLIYTEERVGSGTDKDPYRTLQQLHALEGGLVAEKDEYTNTAIFNPTVIDDNDMDY